MNELQQEIERNNNLQRTKNGAVGFSTTGNELVDLNFKVPSFRNGVPEEDRMKFRAAMARNLRYAVKWLFFVRDAREGLGERRAFTDLFTEFFRYDSGSATKVISLIAEYGRWKDIFDIVLGSNDCVLRKECFDTVKNQLSVDAKNFAEGKSVSLLAKWAPSINASDMTRRLALELRDHLGLSSREYRKMLSNLRAQIGVVERMTCANKWGEINYEHVPSKANLRYKDAFLKHDRQRREAFLDAVLNTTDENKPKINASVLYPYEIWAKYVHSQSSSCWRPTVSHMDDSLEALWQNMKDIDCGGNTMVVCDGSGSMTTRVGTSGNVQALDVSRSLSVYFAERCNGEFKNKFIEFSQNPRFIDINGCPTLFDKIKKVSSYNDCGNTDIEKVFLIILKAAVSKQMKQSDLPERILIISDMEFDNATTYNRWDGDFQSEMSTLFENIEKQYNKAGYKMPKLVFWNVNSRTNTIPVTQSESGVILVSGFSVNIARMVMSGKADPWLALKETLDGERYSLIDEALDHNEN